jgi:hypothetical protein
MSGIFDCGSRISDCGFGTRSIRKFQLACVIYGQWSFSNHVEFSERGHRGHIGEWYVCASPFFIMRSTILAGRPAWTKAQGERVRRPGKRAGTGGVKLKMRHIKGTVIMMFSARHRENIENYRLGVLATRRFKAARVAAECRICSFAAQRASMHVCMYT